jgi:hypothetical protein
LSDKGLLVNLGIDPIIIRGNIDFHDEYSNTSPVNIYNQSIGFWQLG